MHILIPDDLPLSAITLLNDAGYHTDARAGRPRQTLVADVAAADALIVRSATKVDAELIAAAVNLRVIARAGVGVDNIDLAAAERRGIAVMNAPEATTVSVAELTLAGLLNLARHVSAADRSMKAGAWEKKAFAGTELAGKTLGVIGFGRIGRQVAHLASAFGMQILAHDLYAVTTEGAARLVSLEELCAQSDYITLHIPVTPATRRLIDEQRLSGCKMGVRIVNTARGDLIDEAALLSALDSGRVGGAALDVFSSEPPVDTTLSCHPAVVATPHVAASTAEAQERVGLEAASAVRDFLQTGVARNVVTR